MAPEENIMAELDVVKQMAALMKGLDDDGKRRALWYLADLAGLSSRASAQQPQPPMPQMIQGGTPPMRQRGPMPPDIKP
jgi:hypothetical protein